MTRQRQLITSGNQADNPEVLMNVASLDLCRELFELSGWDKTDKAYADGKIVGDKKQVFVTAYNNPYFGHELARVAPAYDLGYLMRQCKSEGGIICRSQTYTARRPAEYGAWPVGYKDPLHGRIGWDADTPENAMCIMFIELFKVGIMKPPQS